jgi:hypothetical protein
MKDFIEFGSIKMLNGALKKGAAYISENLLIISFNLNGNKIFFLKKVNRYEVHF